MPARQRVSQHELLPPERVASIRKNNIDCCVAIMLRIYRDAANRLGREPDRLLVALHDTKSDLGAELSDALKMLTLKFYDNSVEKDFIEALKRVGLEIEYDLFRLTRTITTSITYDNMNLPDGIDVNDNGFAAYGLNTDSTISRTEELSALVLRKITAVA